MPPNKATKADQKGQALPLGLAFLVCAILLLGLGFRLGDRMLQQERVLMRADLTAYSGGVLVARSLNILTYTEKVRMTGEVLELIPFVSALGAALANGVGGFQKFFIPIAPWLIDADMVMVGNANEVLALPLWNQPDALGGLSLSRLKPDLRVQQSQGGSDKGSGSNDQGGSSGEGQSGSSSSGADHGLGALGLDLGPLSGLFGADQGANEDGQDAYHYHSTQDGQRHDLGADEAAAVLEKGPGGGTTTRYKDKRTHRYVAKDKKKQSDGYGLNDQGGHFVAVLAVQTSDDQQPRQRPGLTVACSQVRIAGGDVNALHMAHGADYAPFFVPVRNASDSQLGDSAKTLRQGLTMLKRMGVDASGLAGWIQAADQALQVQH